MTGRPFIKTTAVAGLVMALTGTLFAAGGSSKKSNLNAPTPLYIVQTMGYFSPAVIQRPSHTLPAGESMTLRYRAFVHPQRWDT